MTTAAQIADLLLALEAWETFETYWTTSSTGGQAKIAAVASGASDDKDGRLATIVKDKRVSERGIVEAARARHAAIAQVKLQHLAIDIDLAQYKIGTKASTLLGSMLRDEMVATSKVFKSRGVTNNAPAAVTGTGTGEVVMLALDDAGLALEAVYPEVITFTCTVDKHNGRTAGMELWKAIGEKKGEHVLAGGGSGAVVQNIQTSWAENTTALSNPGFNTDSTADAAFDASTDTAKLTGWTIGGTATLVNADSTNVFRTLSSGTSRSIALTSSIDVYQTYTYKDSDGPVLCAIPVNPTIATASGGSAILTAGNASTTLAVSSMAGGWEWITLVKWPKQLKGAASQFKFEWDSASSGQLYFGPAVMRPLTKVGGKWFGILPGATDFVEGDYSTQTTTVADTGKAKKALHELFGYEFELPHNATASTGWADW